MSGINESLNQRKAQALPRGSAVMCEWYVDSAENATIWSTDGREFIDFAGGIAVLNTGHRHPKITQAVTEQLQKFTHTAFQIVPYESYITLAERINQRVPVEGPAKTAFFSTGAEALENAVKIARSATGRHGVITFTGSFHGRTMMTMAMTGKVAPYKQDFGPMVPSVFHARFPDGKKVSTEQALESLHDIFSCDIAPHNVAALVIEPIQGEGGFRVVPQAFMQALRDIADQHGILLIADEVQSGFARTGKLFAMEHFTAKADIITMAKSLAGGYPLSAVSGRAEIMDAPNPGGLGGTYAGNPLAIAAAITVLEIIEEEDLCAKANNLGNELVDTLTQLSQHCSAIEQVRGLGSMIAVELKDAHTAKAIQDTAMSQGLLLLTCGQKGNVIRFLYPLTIPTDQFRKGVKILSEALTQHAT